MSEFEGAFDGAKVTQDKYGADITDPVILGRLVLTKQAGDHEREVQKLDMRIKALGDELKETKKEREEKVSAMRVAVRHANNPDAANEEDEAGPLFAGKGWAMRFVKRDGEGSERFDACHECGITNDKGIISSIDGSVPLCGPCQSQRRAGKNA